MSDQAARAVLNGTTTTGTTRLVQLCLGVLADHTGKVQIAQKLLGRAACVSSSSVKRALAELEAIGALAVTEAARGTVAATYQLIYQAHRDTPKRVHRGLPKRVHGEPPLADSRGNTPFTELLTTDEGLAADATASRRQVAAQLVRAVYDERTPKPVAKRVAVVKMAERFLDAGWTERQVRDAMMATATFTDQALQLQLNRGLGAQPRRPEPPSGPSFVEVEQGSRPVDRGPWVCAVDNPDCVDGFIEIGEGVGGRTAKPCECRVVAYRRSHHT